MKFRYALLANYAEKNELGAITVVGGGYDGYFLDNVPWTIATLAVVAAFDLDVSDLGNQVIVGIRLIDPRGQLVFKGGLSETINAESILEGERLTHFSVFHIANWNVRELGLYRFEILVDDNVVASVPFGLAERNNHGTSESSK